LLRDITAQSVDVFVIGFDAFHGERAHAATGSKSPAAAPSAGSRTAAPGRAPTGAAGRSK
jgi:hypothetical protein